MNVTRKEIMRDYERVISVHYCGIQRLLRGAEKLGVWTGEYGWYADVYQIDPETVIVTGYRPFGNFIADYDLCRKYDSMGADVWDSTADWNIGKDKCQKLIAEFVKEVCGE